MKRILIVLLLLVGVLPSSYADRFGDMVTKEKKISKHYTGVQSKILNINNQFGDININTWDKNEVSVDIHIEVKRRSESKAQDLLDDIEISIDERKTGYYFKTGLNRRTINNSNGERMRIDYVVYMPRNMAMDIKNQFGNVVMADFEGDIDMDVQYGDLKMGSITGTEKAIKVQFGKVNIKNIEVARMDIQYSPLIIGSGQRLGIKNQFGRTSIDNVQSLNIKQEYGDLDIRTVSSITGKVQFAGVLIDKVNRSVDLSLEYCSKSKFGIIGADVNMLKVKSSFSSLYFNFDKNANFNADIKVSFGSFKNGNEQIKQNIHRIDDNDDPGEGKQYTGKIGSGTGTMVITSNYGNIVFE